MFHQPLSDFQMSNIVELKTVTFYREKDSLVPIIRDKENDNSFFEKEVEVSYVQEQDKADFTFMVTLSAVGLYLLWRLISLQQSQ